MKRGLIKEMKMVATALTQLANDTRDSAINTAIQQSAQNITLQLSHELSKVGARPVIDVT